MFKRSYCTVEGPDGFRYFIKANLFQRWLLRLNGSKIIARIHV